LPYYRSRLEKLIQVSRDHGIEPLFITQPTLYGPGIDPATGVDLEKIKLGENLNGALMFAVVDMYNQTLRQVAAKDHVLLIDLARELPRNSLYYYDYLHYTEAGAAAVAEIIYRGFRPFIANHFAGCTG
jgi:lysophospholipase L1-like esterase